MIPERNVFKRGGTSAHPRDAPRLDLLSDANALFEKGNTHFRTSMRTTTFLCLRGLLVRAVYRRSLRLVITGKIIHFLIKS